MIPIQTSTVIRMSPRRIVFWKGWQAAVTSGRKINFLIMEQEKAGCAFICPISAGADLLELNLMSIFMIEQNQIRKQHFRIQTKLSQRHHW